MSTTLVSDIGIHRTTSFASTGSTKEQPWKSDKKNSSSEEEIIRTDSDVVHSSSSWKLFITLREGKTSRNTIETPPETKVMFEQQSLTVSSGLQFGRYSEEYISYQTQEFVKKLAKEFSEWEKIGAKEGIANIATMKELVDEYLPYLSQRTENRIFITVIELLLENHTWQKITNEQLRSFQKALERFQKKNLEWKGLEILYKALHELQLYILIPHEPKPEKEAKDKKESGKAAH